MKHQRWMALCLGMVVATSAASVLAAGIDTNSPLLPPLDGRYLSPQDVHAQYGNSTDALYILLKRPEHNIIVCREPGSTGGVNRTKFPDPVLGPHEAEDFCSDAEGDVQMVTGGNPQPEFHVQTFPPLLPNTRTRVDNRYNPDGTLRETGTFDTEMLQMNMTGPGFMIRESPTRASTGQTTITALGGGMYHIDSFFDVFTELSIDGGQTWMPSTGSNRMELVPEPSSMVLAGLGVLGLFGYAARRRRAA